MWRSCAAHVGCVCWCPALLKWVISVVKRWCSVSLLGYWEKLFALWSVQSGGNVMFLKPILYSNIGWGLNKWLWAVTPTKGKRPLDLLLQFWGFWQIAARVSDVQGCSCLLASWKTQSTWRQVLSPALSSRMFLSLHLETERHGNASFSS